VYHGIFGTGFFQALYTAEPAVPLMFCTSIEYHVLVTVPLLVLSVPFHFVLPLALTSLMLSVGICVAAAVQADLPKNKLKFWSRPLVALLFFLQPVVRGWARYQGRLGFRPIPAVAEARAGSLRQRDRGEPLDYFCYWSPEPLDRVEFVNRILAQLEQQGWPSKADSGWCDHDVEILGSRWSRLQLTTVSEQLAGRDKLFRCRLRASWSLPAKLAFWSAFGFEMLIIGVVAGEVPWLWMLLLTMPVLGVFLEQEKRNMQRMISSFLDEVAKQCRMTKLEYQQVDEKFAPVIAKS
jgi:hypothetical protein